MFILLVGVLMIANPAKANQILRKAGSTPLINYGELSIRMIPAFAMIHFADHSQIPQIFTLFGWFMIVSSIVLMVMPRRWHHAYAVKCADILKPHIIPWLAPVSFLFGGWVLWMIW